MNLREKISEIFKNKKNRKLIFLLVAAGILLLSLSGVFFNGGEMPQDTETEGLEDYKSRLEKELADACYEVNGVGTCKVIVTFSKGEEKVYKGSNLIESKPPQVQGITVICAGADNDSVRASLTAMFVALYGIGSNRIAVLKLE